MARCIKYVHTNIVAKNWKRLAEFYISVFDCMLKPPERILSGKWLDRLTCTKNSHIEGVHLLLPGYGAKGPTLEIFQYAKNRRRRPPRINRPGFAHIAFSVENVMRMLSRVTRSGGSQVGELVKTDIDGVGIINVVYARDPEGNIIELQNWAPPRQIVRPPRDKGSYSKLAKTPVGTVTNKKLRSAQR